jgi:hypothetical protein
MRKFSILFLILFLGFTAIQIFAQKMVKLREVIIIEFLAPNHKEFRKDEIFINKKPKSEFEVGGGSGSECGECTPEQIDAQPSDYLYTARVFRMGKNKANIGFEISVDGECKTQKVFAVYRNQQTKIQLNCGVSLIAYYGFESKKAN